MTACKLHDPIASAAHAYAFWLTNENENKNDAVVPSAFVHFKNYYISICISNLATRHKMNWEFYFEDIPMGVPDSNPSAWVENMISVAFSAQCHSAAQ